MRAEVVALTQRYDLTEGGFTQQLVIRLPNGDELTLDVADPSDIARVLAAGQPGAEGPDEEREPESAPAPAPAPAREPQSQSQSQSQAHAREFGPGFMPHAAELGGLGGLGGLEYGGGASSPTAIGEVAEDAEMPI